MAKKLDVTVVAEWEEYGAEMPDGSFVKCDSEAEARATGGKVMVRKVYETSWQ